MRIVSQQVSFGESGGTYFAVAVTAYLETGAQCVDGFHTDTVQSDTLLECFTVVLTTCVQHADRFNQLSLRNASSVVADTDTKIFFNGNLNFLTGLHFELVNTVVDYFFQEDIDSVFGMRTVAQPADIHTGACADMLHVAQVADVVVSVLYCIVVVYRYQFVLFHSCFLFYLFDERTAALMLLSLKVIPLSLNFSVQFEFGVAFCKDKT